MKPLFIRLMSYNTGKPIFVNAVYISEMHELDNGTGTRVLLASVSNVVRIVKEVPEEILEKIAIAKATN